MLIELMTYLLSGLMKLTVMMGHSVNLRGNCLINSSLNYYGTFCREGHFLCYFYQLNST